jgi:ATP/maltotriose-dependent transcriptional regulator MalT
MGDLRLAQADFAGARQEYEDSLGLRTSIGEQGSIAETRLSLAELSFAEGHPEKAQADVRAAIDEFHKEGLRDLEIAARGLLARILIEQKDTAEARKSIEPARTLLAGNENPYIGLGFVVDKSYVQAASGRAAEARKALDKGIADAQAFGFVELQFKMRLALCRIELQPGNTARGRSRLAELEKDAKAKGFVFIARQASGTLAAVKVQP